MDRPPVWRVHGSSTAAVLVRLVSAQVECADTANACSSLEGFVNEFAPLRRPILILLWTSQTLGCDA
jgi:hypothetical protein